MGLMTSMGAGIDKGVDKLTDAFNSTIRGMDKVVGVTIDGLTTATKVTMDGLTTASEAVRDGLVKTGGAVSKALRRPSVLQNPNLEKRGGACVSIVNRVAELLLYLLETSSRV